MVDPQAHGRMYGEFVEFLNRDPSDVRGFIRGTYRAAYWACSEANRKLLADLSIVISNHMVRVCVYAGDPFQLYEDSGLLLNLTDNGLPY